jgi:hypothetical protein
VLCSAFNILAQIQRIKIPNNIFKYKIAFISVDLSCISSIVCTKLIALLEKSMIDISCIFVILDFIDNYSLITNANYF